MFIATPILKLCAPEESMLPGMYERLAPRSEESVETLGL